MILAVKYLPVRSILTTCWWREGQGLTGGGRPRPEAGRGASGRQTTSHLGIRIHGAGRFVIPFRYGTVSKHRTINLPSQRDRSLREQKVNESQALWSLWTLRANAGLMLGHRLQTSSWHVKLA